MSENIPVPDRSPLHARALRAQDLRKGRFIAVVNRRRQLLFYYRVAETPAAGQDSVWLMELNANGTRPLRQLHLSHMGVIPYPEGIGWHPDQVTLDVAECKDRFPECQPFTNPEFEKLAALLGYL